MGREGRMKEKQKHKEKGRGMGGREKRGGQERNELAVGHGESCGAGKEKKKRKGEMNRLFYPGFRMVVFHIGLVSSALDSRFPSV